MTGMADTRPLIAIVDDEHSVPVALHRLCSAYGYRTRHVSLADNCRAVTDRQSPEIRRGRAPRAFGGPRQPLRRGLTIDHEGHGTPSVLALSPATVLCQKRGGVFTRPRGRRLDMGESRLTKKRFGRSRSYPAPAVGYGGGLRRGVLR